MGRGAMGFVTGLLQGGLKGYQLRKDWDEADEKRELTKLQLAKAKREESAAVQLAADDQAVRDALQTGSADTTLDAPSDGSRQSILQRFGESSGAVAEPAATAPSAPTIEVPTTGTDAAPAPAPPSPGPSAVMSSIMRPAAGEQDAATPAVGQAGQVAAATTLTQPALPQQDSPATTDAGRAGLATTLTQPTMGEQVTPLRSAIEKRSGFDVDKYLNDAGPKVIQTLVKQGRIKEAKAFSDFASTQQGQTYARSWATGVRQLSMGNINGALTNFERLYNEGLPDGNTIKLQPIEGRDGQFTINQYGSDGKLMGSRQGSGAQIASSAALYLSPAEAVKHFAGEQAKRTAAADLTARQEHMELLRQDGREAADQRTAARAQAAIDAADARSARQIDAADARLDRTLGGRANGGGRPLTPAQLRGNAEIQAARDAVIGMTPEDIRRRTAPTTATGRENADYDPALSRLTKLAMRRKIGDDDEFDQQQRGPEAPAATKPAASPGRTEVLKRFQADRSMNSYKLGQETSKGVEVLNGAGKLVGYYR